MSFRNAKRQMSNQVARTERNRMKLLKLRDKVRQSTSAFITRQHARLAWWQSAFGTPIAGVNWMLARASSLWAAFLALLGFSGKSYSASASRRPVAVRRSLLRTAMCEGLEQRQLMAADFYVDQTADFVVTSNNAGGVGADPTDEVSWVGFNGVDNAGFGDDANGLIFANVATVGATAYDSIQAAINAAAASGDTIRLAPGTYTENLTIAGKSLTILGPNNGVAGTSMSRVGEAILVGKIDIDGASNVVVDGIRIENTTGTGNTIEVQTDGQATITNNVLFAVVPGGDNADSSAALRLFDSSTGTVNFTNNLVTGNFTGNGKYFNADEAAWRWGVFANGGGHTVNITGNTFDSTRSAIQLGQNNGFSIQGNTFSLAGTGITIGDFPLNLLTIDSNTFGDVDLDINGQNVTAGFNLNLTTSFNSAPSQLFTVSGGAGATTVTGTAGADLFSGKAGGVGDTFTGLAGDDLVLGSSGNDVAVFTVPLTPSLITPDGSYPAPAVTGWKVQGGVDGTDVLNGVESVQDSTGKIFRLVGTTGFATIQDAINASSAGNVILMPNGLVDAGTLDTAGKGGLVINAGNSPGQVTVGSMSLNVSDTVPIEIVTTVLPTGFDNFIVNSGAAGNVSLGNATLTVDDTGATFSSSPIVIIDNDGSDAVVGTFAGLAEGAIVTGIAGNKFAVSYVGGTGNDVTLSLVAKATAVTASDTFVQEDLATKVFPNNGQFTIKLTPVNAVTLLPYTLTGQANSESGTDYNATASSVAIGATGTLTIPANATEYVVDIDVIDDLLHDGGNETVILNIGALNATMSIVDNEAAPTISIAATDATATENAGGTDPGKFTVTMTGASDTATTVVLNYTAPGNPASIAVNGTDYTAPVSVTIAAGTTFQAGSTSSTADVIVTDDALVENSETVKATLGTVTGNTGITASGNATVTIADTPDTSNISIGSFSSASIAEDSGKATAVISMTSAASTDTVVKYVLFTGTTAVEGTDYTLGDINEREANNTLFGPQPLTNGPQGLAGFSIAPNTNIASATSTPHVTITSTNATNNSTADVYAFYTATGGNATFDIDNSTGGFNSFLEVFDSSGASLGKNDNSFEGAGLGSGAGPNTVDAALTVNLPGAGVYYVRVTEGTLAASPSGAGASAGATTGASATQGYQLHLSVPGADGYAVIGAGSTSVPLSVQVLTDTLVEPTEVVNVRLDSITLSDPDISFANASAADVSRNATVSITDNDVATVSSTATKAFEPSTNGVYTFTQTLKSATDTVIKLVIDPSSTTKNFNNKTANDPQDHLLFQNVGLTETVTILAGQTQVTLTVPVVDSALIEDDESLFLAMSLVGSTDPEITIDTTANPGSLTKMVFGDEDAAVVDVDATFAPAVEGGAIGKFTFFLSEAPLGYPFAPLMKSDRDVVIEYTIGGTAINGTDYATLSGTATIPAFSSTATILVDATGAFDDLILEGPETVSITITKLLTPTDAGIGIGAGSPSDSLVINDNDALTVKVAATAPTFENGANGSFTFSTSGSGTTLVPTVVTYQVKVASSTAVEGVDFTTLTGTLTIPAGAAPQSVVVPIAAINDGLFEGTETITLEILTVSGGPGVVEDPLFGEATGQIIDDESGKVTITKTLDAAEGSTDGLFTVTLGGQSPLPTVVKLEVLPAGINNATPGTDYVAIGGPFRTITFNPFQTQVTVPVDVIDDSISEPTESVIVEVDSVLSGAYSVDPAPATVAILSDQTVKITASDPTAAEPSNNGAFTLTLHTGALATTSSVDTVVTFTIATGAGKATNGSDYTTIPLSATIPANSTNVVIPVSVLDDSTLELSEDVTITLTGISSGNADITVDAGAKVATVTIADNDAAYVTVKATDPNGSDNPGSDDDGAFTVFISQPSDSATVVTYSIAGTANPSQLPVGDYVALTGTVTIPANATSVLIPVDVLNDPIIEGSEDVTIKLLTVTSPNPNIFLGAIGGPVLKFQQGFNSYTGTQDTYLSQTFSGANFDGNSVEIDTDSIFAPTAAEHGLLRFDSIFGSTLIPVGSPIASATLGLTSFNAGPVVLHQMLQTWNEATQTWNNATLGNVTPGIQNDDSEAAIAGQAVGLGFGLNSIPVTSIVQSWANTPATNFGWAFLPGGTLIAASFESSEDGTATQRPFLTVTLDLTATVTITDTDTAQVNVTGNTNATEPGSPGSIIVSMANPATSNVVVVYQDNLTGTAISGSDYTPLNGTVTILAGNTSASIVISPLNDSLVEAPESVNITLLSATSVDPDITLGPTVNGTTNIVDTDFALVTVSSTTNGDENTVGDTTLTPINGKFVISMSTPSSVNTVVSLAIGGTATDGADYASIPLSVTIPANFLSTTIPVTVIDDLINEAAIETVTLTLTGVTAGHLTQTFIGAPSSGQVDIADDEQQLAVNNVVTKAIATEGGPNGEFQFQLNFPSDKDTVIAYKLQPSGTATVAVNGSVPDFNASALPGSVGPSFTTGTVTILAGATTIALPVVAFQDYIADNAETVVLAITSAVNANTNTTDTADETVTINDVVYTVSVVAGDSPAAEPGPPSGSNGQFTFTLTAPLPEPTVVTYTVGGTAIPSPSVNPAPLTADYVGLSGTVTIPANTTQFKLDIDVIDDLIAEGDETVTITLTGAASAGPSYVFPLGVPTVGVSGVVATETIKDNEVATLTITGVDGTELNQQNAANDGKFIISQGIVSATNTEVTYTIVSGTATNGTDYAAITGTLTATIPAGQTTVAVAVDILPDTTMEPNETVVMKLIATKGPTDPQITIVGTTQATVNITDDDTATISIVPTGPFGFEPGTNDGQYSVILSNPSSVNTVVTYALIAPGATDAVPDSDFKLRDGALNLIGTLTGTVTILAGQTSTPIIVDVLDDNIIENNELVNVKLTGTDNPSKITVNATPATITILDFGSIDQDKGEVTIAKLVDGDEAPVGVGKTDGQFILTLVPTNPSFNMANGPFSSDEDTVVTYSISGGSATNPSDHTLATTGTVTIPAGQLTAILTVPVVDDNIAEVVENLTVTLTGVVAPTHTPAISVSATPATISMLDDDLSILSITSETKAEGALGTTSMVFTVTSPMAVAPGFTVPFTVSGGNATNGVDYTVANGTLTFTGLAGEQQTITVAINGDNVVELDETFNVTLGATSQPLLAQGGAVGVGTVTNDDTATITIDSPSVVEGTNATPGAVGATTTPLPFTISSSNPIDIPYTIDVILGNGTAIGGDIDIKWLAGTPVAIPVNAVTGWDFDNDAGNDKANISRVTFPAAANAIGVQPLPTAQTITVRVVQDNFVEGGTVNNPGVETIAASLADINSPTRSTITTATGTGTITDDDAATVSLLANDNKASEPLDTVNEGNGQFTVTQTQLSSSDTVIKYTIAVNALSATPSGVSALEDDYTKLSGTVTIPAGQSTATIDVIVLDNALLEDDETVTITLDSIVSSDPNVTLAGKLTDTVTIFDDDQATVSILANDNAASEDPLDNGQFTLTLSSVSDTDTVVTYSITTGPTQATNGSDYTTLSGTATIAAGKTTTTIDVVVLPDVTPEGAETVTLTLTGFLSPTNADIKVGGANNDTVTIADDVDGIIVSVVPNGDGTEGGSNGSFLVKITKSDGVTPVPAPASGLTVNYSSAGGTAVGGPSGDHVALTGSIFIPPGATTGLIDVSVINDSIVEVTETVNVELVTLSLSSFPSPLPPFSEPVGIGTSKASVNIIDNDTAAFTINSVTVNEGDGTAQLTVSLSNPIDIASKVDISLTGGNATGGGVDYDSTTQSVSFTANSTAPQSITIPITDDALLEGVEGFGAFLALSLATPLGGRSASFGSGSVTILDNEVSPLLKVGDIRVAGSTWTSNFRDAASGVVVGSGTGTGYAIPTGSSAQTRPLPWGNVDRLVVSFSTPLQASTVIAGTSVTVTGTLPGTPAYTTTVSGNDLIVSFASALPVNNYKLAILDTVTNTSGSALDGEFTNGVTALSGSGNGIAGGSLGGAAGFRFVINPGDANQNGLVNSVDANLIYDGFFTSSGSLGYSIFADMTGNNFLNSADVNVVYDNFFAAPPVSFPGSLGGGFGSLFGSGSGGSTGTGSPSTLLLGNGSNGSNGSAVGSGSDYGYLFVNDNDEDETFGLGNYSELDTDVLDGVFGDMFGSELNG